MTSLRRRARPPGPAQPRPELSAARFPHLAAFLSGYLHQDFLLEHPTPVAALAAFLADADAAERHALREEWRAFRAAVADVDWQELRAALAALGGAWRPRSRAALMALFAGFDD